MYWTAAGPFILPDQAQIPIDWQFFDSVDPISLDATQDETSMNEIIHQILRANKFTIEGPARYYHLFQVLQVVIGFLCSTTTNLKNKLRKSKLENRKLCKKMKEIESRPVQFVGTKCPVCLKSFRDLPSLDSHIFRRHASISNVWQIVRTPQPPGSVLVERFEKIPETPPPYTEAQFNRLTAKLQEQLNSTQETLRNELMLVMQEQQKRLHQEFENSGNKKSQSEPAKIHRISSQQSISTKPKPAETIQEKPIPEATVCPKKKITPVKIKTLSDDSDDAFFVDQSNGDQPPVTTVDMQDVPVARILSSPKQEESAKHSSFDNFIEEEDRNEQVQDDDGEYNFDDVSDPFASKSKIKHTSSLGDSDFNQDNYYEEEEEYYDGVMVKDLF